MSFEVVDIPEKRLVVAEFTGAVTGDQLERALRVIRFFLKAYEWNQVLIDMRFSVPMVSAKELEQLFSRESKLVDNCWQFALLQGSSQEEDLHGIDTLADQFGLNFAAFDEEKAAMTWLRSSGLAPEPSSIRHADQALTGAFDGSSSVLN
ncbi:MAG: hypothetical protein ACWA5X_10590 [bacterium]